MKRNVGSTCVVDDREIQAVALGDRAPVVDAGAAERIDAELEAGAADRVHVDDAAEIGDVGFRKSWRCVVDALQRPLVRDALHAASRLASSSLACASIQPVTSRIRRPAVRRVVLEAAILGRVVRRRDDDAVGEAAGAARGCR